MNENQPIQQAYPAPTPDEFARQRVLHRATATRDRTLHRSRLRRRVLSSAFGLTLVCAAILVGPSAYAVYRLNQIAGSVADARSAIFEDYRVQSDGSLRLAGRTIYANGRWRIEHGDRVQVFREGKLSVYEPSEGRLAVYSRPDGPFAYNASGFSVRAMVADMARWNWRQKIETGTAEFEGRTVDRVTITDDSGRERMIVVADPETHFPLQYRGEASTASGWRLRGIAKPRFDVEVDPKTFELHVPKGTKIVDIDKEMTAWTQRIQKPIASFELGDATIALHDITINPRGHIFVLYTNGETKADREEYASMVRAQSPEEAMRLSQRFVHPDLEAHDDIGTEYLVSQGSLQPYAGRPDPEQGVLQNGKLLQGAWLMPKQEAPWRPRTVELKASAYSKGSVVTHTYRVEASEPTSGVIPDWIQFIAMGPRSVSDLLMEERRTRRDGQKARGDWAAVEAGLRADLDEILDRESSRGQSSAKGTTFFELYQALTKTGKREEALEFLRRAAREPVYAHQYPDDEIRRAMAKEGL